jgi:hypothetical protein
LAPPGPDADRGARLSALDALLAGPGAVAAVKRPIPVAVAFADAGGTCETREGPVRYRAGDAILTGVEGEHWPVVRETFLATYRPAPPTRAGEDGRYTKLPALATAVQLTQAVAVPVGWSDDPLHGKPGDWLLRYADGGYGVVGDAIFRETYERVNG